MVEPTDSIESLLDQTLGDKTAKDLPAFNDVELTFLFGLRNSLQKKGKLILSDKQKKWAESLLERANDPLLDASLRLKRISTVAAAIKRENTSILKDIKQWKEKYDSNLREIRRLEKEKKSYKKTILGLEKL